MKTSGRGRKRPPDARARLITATCFVKVVLCELPACSHPAQSTQVAQSKPIAATEWSHQRRELYHRIAVEVAFSPADAALEQLVWRDLERVDPLFNIYRDDSELSRLNAARDQRELVLSPELAQALTESQRVFKLSQGAFDPTIGPLVQLWRQAASTGVPPVTNIVSEAHTLVGMEAVRLDGTTLRIAPPGRRFDLGGLVKGLAVDRAIAALRRAGRSAALVKVGGEIAVFGLSPRGEPQAIGVQHPERPAALWARLRDPGTGLSLSTSGNARNPTRIGERVYYHIIDPRSGEPVDAHVLSVSVAFPRTGLNALADGLATAAAVLGPHQAMKIVGEAGGEVLFLQREADAIRSWQSAGWQALTAGSTSQVPSARR